MNNNKKQNFLVRLFSFFEGFNKESYEEDKIISKEQKIEQENIKQELKDSETTIDDVAKERKSHVRHIFKKILLIGFIVILITGAIILAFQDNEQKVRREISPEEVFTDKSSFGKIDQNDYFMKQNILDDKIDVVQVNAKKDNDDLKKLIIKQTDIISENTQKMINKQNATQTKELNQKIGETQEKILEVVNEKLKEITNEQVNLNNEIKKVKTTNKNSRLTLNNGKIVFPNLNNNIKKDVEKEKIQEIEYIEVEEEVYLEEEISMDSKAVLQTSYSTNTLNIETKKKFKPFTVDLTLSMAKITLLEGVKAAASLNGLSNPSPAIMILEDILYTANEEVADLKGCFLSGAAIGNINTSRVEIFGTHLSCIIVADDGKKYKIEKTFKKNRVWIKGEDGGTGIQAQIVDSSGKLIAKSAAMGFMQGLSNFFLAKSTTTTPITTNGTTSLVSSVGSNLQNGGATGVNKAFDIIIKRYEKILDGYYPYLDVKGGRTNLTAVFGGEMKLEVTEYVEPNLDELRRNNLSRGYQNENK